MIAAALKLNPHHQSKHQQKSMNLAEIAVSGLTETTPEITEDKELIKMESILITRDRK